MPNGEYSEGDPREEQGWQDMAEQEGADSVAPGEHRIEIHEAVTPRGRVVRSGMQRVSGANPRTRYPDVLRVRHLLGDCGCLIRDADDLAECQLDGCGRIVCIHRNHAATCGFCGRVCCHVHYGRVRLGPNEVRNACSDCIDRLTTTRFQRVLRHLRRASKQVAVGLWHRWRHRRQRNARTRVPQQRH